MANKPEGAYSPSDDELDELVSGVADVEEDTPTEVPESPSSDAVPPTNADAQPETTDAPDTTEVGKHDEDEAHGTQPAPVAEVIPSTPVADAAPPVPAGAKPFQFKASGGDRVLPGVLELPDGSAVIPKDVVGTFRRTLASAHELQVNLRQHQREHDRKLKELAEERTAKDVEADEISKLFKDLTAKSEDELWEWVQQFKADAPTLALEIERKKLAHDRQQWERQKAGPVPTEEDLKEQRHSAVTTELNATFARMEQHPDVKQWLTRAELANIYQKHLKRPDRLVSIADADDPAAGIKKGQSYYDDSDVLDDLNMAIDLKKRAGPSGAAARNAAANADAVQNPIPPAPRGGKTSTVVPGAQRKKPWSRQSFMAGEQDDDVEDVA